MRPTRPTARASSSITPLTKERQFLTQSHKGTEVKETKRTLEFTLVRAELTASPEKRLLRTNLICVDLIWPRAGIAKKSAAREMTGKKGVVDFSKEEWVKRVLFREEVLSHCGVAVSVTEPVTIQLARRFLRLTAKYALKMGADFTEKAMVGYADIASSPIDALAQMLGEKDSPKAIAQGVLDLESLPDAGEVKVLSVPLVRPQSSTVIGRVTLEVRGE